jgi:hypothetical protein
MCSVGTATERNYLGSELLQSPIVSTICNERYS